jgi:hypothetical protein
MLINKMLSPIFAERIDDYYRRLKESENIKGVVGFLRLLIQGNGSNQIPLIYKGNIAVRTVSTKNVGFNLYTLSAYMLIEHMNLYMIH